MPTVDFTDPAVIRDPYPSLRTLLAGPPVQWNDSLGAWGVFRHQDVRQAFRMPELSSDRISPFVRAKAGRNPDIAYLGRCIGLWMVFNDPPVHTRLRKLVQMAFLPQAIEALRPAVRAEVDRLIGDLQRRGAEADFVRDFAYPLPANVIALLLGVPRGDIDALKTWSDDLARFVLTSVADPEKYAPAANALRAMNDYFERLIAGRRARPEGGILDRLILAHDGDDLLSREELLAACVLLLFAGHETTTHFLSGAMRVLSAHPDQLRALHAARDDKAVVRSALNEVLRFDGPIIALSRIASADCAIAGQPVKRGDRVYLFSAAANRDAQVFADPDRFDRTRADATRMITFGFGAHTCLGVHLAMLEGEEALPRLLDALDGWRIRPHDPEFSTTLVVRGVARLPMAPAGA